MRAGTTKPTARFEGMIAHDVTLDELKADTLSCIMLFYRQKRGMSLECWVREHLSRTQATNSRIDADAVEASSTPATTPIATSASRSPN